MNSTSSESVIDALDLLIKSAQAAGATDCDGLAVERESVEVRVRLGEIENVTVARERRVGLRCLVDGATAVASTANLNAASLRDFARQIVEMARILPRDEYAGLPEAGSIARQPWPDLAIIDPDAPLPEPAQAADLARRAETRARSADPRISNSDGAEMGASRGRVAYASTAGDFRGAFESSRFGLSVAPIAEQDGKMQRAGWGHSTRRLQDLESPESIGAEAARRTLRSLGARRVPTARLPVIFEAPVAAGLLGHLASAISGGTLYRGTSFLREALGTRILPEFVQIVDDGRRIGGLATRPFDGEGLPTRRTNLVENGILRSFLLDTYSARRLGMASTGNASRGVGGSPGAGATNLKLMPGEQSLEQMIAGIQQGLLITGLSGMGVNLVTGDYSRGATGHWIENGELAFPVEEITVAGNLREMFLGIEAIGNDPRPDSTVSCPSLRLPPLTIGGS